MNEQLYQYLDKEVEISVGITKVKIPVWQLLDQALPHIKNLTQDGLTLKNIEDKIDLFLEAPWKDLDRDDSMEQGE